MQNKCNVVIIESQRGFSEKIRDYLQTKGVSSHALGNMNEVSKSLLSLVMPIILVELPENSDAMARLLEDYTKIHNVKNYPLIVIGRNACSFEDQLNSDFELALCFNKPTNNADILEALNYIADNFSFPTQENMPSPSKAMDSSGAAHQPIVPPPPSAKKTQVEELDETLPASELYASFSSIPNLFFDELNKYNLLTKDFNGKKYVTFNNENSAENKDYWTTDDVSSKAFQEIADKLPKFLLTRIHRVAYLSNQIIGQITQDPALIEEAKQAAALFNWSLMNEQKVFFKKDYMTLKSKAFRKDLCSKVKDSAMKCAIDLSKAKVADIIAKIGKYIGREEQVTEDPTSIVASTIAAVDMVDRAVWQNNHFNPRAAYKIMVMAKSGQLSEFHPVVLCCIIKLLSEALASNIKMFLIPRKQKLDPVLVEAAKQTREQTLNAGERKVEINELTPGMRLSRPLIAFDGREILDKDMVLDQDLIWRIWQLSMVRALNAPLVVEG